MNNSPIVFWSPVTYNSVDATIKKRKIKVKNGKLLTGHDYENLKKVTRAIDDFFASKQLKFSNSRIDDYFFWHWKNPDPLTDIDINKNIQLEFSS